MLLKTPSPLKSSSSRIYQDSNGGLSDMEEMLRKRIEETNQKISDYL
jgi:hypothetical protein